MHRPDRARILAPVTITVALALVAGPASAACSKASWSDFERQLLAAQNAFQHRDPGPLKALWSRDAQVSLMGALGGHEVGWTAVEPRLAWVSAATANGDHGDQVLTKIVGSDLALIVQIESISDPKPDQPLAGVNHLRVTHVARCEGDAWRLVHRHADPLVETRRPEAPADRSGAR